MTPTTTPARTYGSSTVSKVSGANSTVVHRHATYQHLPPLGAGEYRRWTLGQMVTAAVVAEQGRGGQAAALGPLLELLCLRLPQVIDDQAPDVAPWVLVQDEQLLPVHDLVTAMDLLRRGHLIHVVDLRPILERVAEVTAGERAPP